MVTLVEMSYWPFAVGILPRVLVDRWSSPVSERRTFEIILHLGEDSASQLVVTVIQKVRQRMSKMREGEQCRG